MRAWYLLGWSLVPGGVCSAARMACMASNRPRAGCFMRGIPGSNGLTASAKPADAGVAAWAGRGRRKVRAVNTCGMGGGDVAWAINISNDVEAWRRRLSAIYLIRRARK